MKCCHMPTHLAQEFEDNTLITDKKRNHTLVNPKY